MAGRLVRTIPSRWLTALAVGLIVSINSPGALASPPNKSFTAEDIYAALVEPALADGGKITSEKRQAILVTARKLLDEQQVQELDARLAAYRTGTVVHTTSAAAPGTLLGPEPKSWHESPSCAPEILHEDKEHSPEGFFDNLTLFAGLDGAKQPQDLGINANFGGRAAVNWGFPILESVGLGGQIGTSVDHDVNAVHVLDQIQGTTQRNQYFTTVGVFERTAWGLNAGIGYDFLSEKYYQHFDLSQWRGQVGYALNDQNEVGTWATLRDRGDSGTLLGTTVHLKPLSQINLYWQHLWPNNAETSGWIGVTESHGRVVFLLPDNSASGTAFNFGAQINVPLNNYIAIYGAANFVAPPDTGTVDAFLGFVLYPRGGAQQAHERRFAPLLPLANNPFFSVDMRR